MKERLAYLTDTGDGVEMFIPDWYSASFIGQLKNNIPSSYREWLKEMKVWVIDYLVIDDLISLLNDYGVKVVWK